MAARAKHMFSFFTPNAVARSAAGLVAFSVRHPRVFSRLLREGGHDRKALIRLLRLPIDLDAIRNSPLFDRDWYTANHPELARSGMSPELHYLLHGASGGHLASPAFSGGDYLELNPEVRASGLNPLVHYEIYGRFTGCPATPNDVVPQEPSFPPGVVEVNRCFSEAPCIHARTAVFATFSPDGHLARKDILYVRGLREVCDNVVVVANSPLFNNEAEKLRGIASAVICRWHGSYDFGSYRIGLHAAREHGWLAPERCKELVFANSSCYAPVRPFADMFNTMEKRVCDFWGLTFNTQRPWSPHLQSFFLVFRRPILDSGALEDFFAERPEHATRKEAINIFEVQLTEHLRRRGFDPSAFVRHLLPHLHASNPMTRPLDLLRRHKSPFVKVKVFSWESVQPPERVLAYVERLNPELAAVIRAAMAQ